MNVLFTCCRADSDTATPPGSPTHPHLKDVFPSKSPNTRRSSRFSITKVENGTVKAQGSSESEAEGRSSDDNQKKSGRTWKTPISSKTKTKNKSKDKKDKDKSKDGKDRVKELRRRGAVKRSNSLDSLTLSQVSEC